MLSRVMDVMEPVLAAPDAASASRLFFDAASAAGATYMQTRVYRRPLGRLTSLAHFAAGGVVTRFSRPGWPGSAGFNFICFDCNPLLDAIRQNRTRYRFGDFAAHDDRTYGDYWDAFSEADVAEALCATAYGAKRAIASIHLGYGDREEAAQRAPLFQSAGQMLVERLLELGFETDAAPREPDLPNLTPRERDCLGFVAEGKSDWEISIILGLSEATARFHVDNARRKLGAVTRAQAVARLAITHGL